MGLSGRVAVLSTAARKFLRPWIISRFRASSLDLEFGLYLSFCVARHCDGRRSFVFVDVGIQVCCFIVSSRSMSSKLTNCCHRSLVGSRFAGFHCKHVSALSSSCSPAVWCFVAFAPSFFLGFSVCQFQKQFLGHMAVGRFRVTVSMILFGVW